MMLFTKGSYKKLPYNQMIMSKYEAFAKNE